MAKIKPLISKKELDVSIMNSVFKGEPHDYFVLYDEVADEFILKFKEPEHPTTIYHHKDNISLIVDLENYQVVGVVFFDFKEKTLPALTQMGEKWDEWSLADHFKEYRTIRYSPKVRDKVSITIDDALLRTRDTLLKKDLVLA